MGEVVTPPTHIDALVSYPGWGSLWLESVRLRDGVVTGVAWFPHPVGGPSYPEACVMNFPLTCVRKWARS